MRRPEDVAAASLVAPLLILAGAAVGGGDAPRSTVFRFADPEIIESSGLALDDGLVLTTNDSGDVGRVFAVDADSGRTVGVTTWSDDPTDVEALAPAGAGHVWVADIGDNEEQRDSVSVSRVPVGRGARTVSEPAYELVYPDGPHDAETLLADPGSGRLYVVTKSVFGGTLLAAPRRLSTGEPNRLTRVGRVLSMATDGAFTADGRHLVLRNYTSAAVYSFPDLAEVGELGLPAQPQGEGLAMASDDAVWLSSEGAHTPVLRVGLPDGVAQAMTTPSARPEPEPTETPAPEVTGGGSGSSTPASGTAAVTVAAAAVVAASAVAVVLWLRRRSRPVARGERRKAR